MDKDIIIWLEYDEVWSFIVYDFVWSVGISMSLAKCIGLFKCMIKL